MSRALPPAIAQVLQHVALQPAEAVMRDLVEAADLDGPVDVDEITAGDALRRHVWLLHRDGDGLPLTAAGWLPPAVVKAAMDALWPQDRWIGKRNREDLIEPVQRLRALRPAARPPARQPRAPTRHEGRRRAARRPDAAVAAPR